MFTRKVVTASAAALAVVALSVPIVNAQGGDSASGGAGAGSVELGSLQGGSSEGGSTGGGSPESGSGEGSGEAGSAVPGSIESGSLDTASADDSSVGNLHPDSEATCELPDLGGSVAKFYPLFGISGIPSGVLDLVTSALGSFPNILDMVAGEGGGAALVGATGSLEAPLCSSIFGGEMVLPPITVIVDEDGNPLTTVTGTVAPGSTSSVTSTSTRGSASSADSAGGPSSPGVVGAGGAAPAGVTGTVALPTSVPVPGP